MQSRLIPKIIGLKRGDSGENVLRLKGFLRRFGYLGDAAANHYLMQTGDIMSLSVPLGRPDSEGDTFDAVTEQSLREYQNGHGINPSGEYDESTHRLFMLPRCGVPDIFRFALNGRRWTKFDITYGVQESSFHLSPQEVLLALRQAFDIWSEQTVLRFTQVAASEAPDILIRFVVGRHGDGVDFDGSGGILAHAFFPPPNGGALAGDAHFDDAELWTIRLPVPAQSFDLVTVIIHEIGHSLGLAHSSVPGSIMQPNYPVINPPPRVLNPDDISSIQDLYPPGLGRSWEGRPGAAWDVGVGANGNVWIIGRNSVPGGFGIFHWNGSDWDNVPGGAVRIAVGPTGRPWVVNSDGGIFEWNGSAFEGRPGAAWDVGVGADGNVWVIGRNSVPGGFGIFHWNGSDWDNVPGGAVRIAVGPTGRPWVVNSDGGIFEWNGSTFEGRPGAAWDVGVGADGSVWVIGRNSVPGGLGIYRWSVGFGNWLGIDGGAVAIAVANNGRPWVVNNASNIFQRV